MGWWRHKNDTKMTITRKIKIWNLVLLSIQPIADLSSKFKKEKKMDFDLAWYPTFKINFFFTFSKFTWKIGNRLNKKKNQIFPISIFRIVVIFETSSPQFSITRTIKIWEFFTIFPILFNTFCTFHKVSITSEGGGSACR